MNVLVTDSEQDGWPMSWDWKLRPIELSEIGEYEYKIGYLTTAATIASNNGGKKAQQMRKTHFREQEKRFRIVSSLAGCCIVLDKSSLLRT